jgi:N-dimethylarginine dimethylaminohydrolase
VTLAAAYGGPKWSARTLSLHDEMSFCWGDWGSSSECGKLHAVLLKSPGAEIDLVDDVDEAQMRARLIPELARQQHRDLVDAYERHGIAVHLIRNGRTDKPNSLFVRDLMLMTPEGAIVARPASTVRAGEERFVAETLANLGVPILLTVHGRGTFEGADVSWVNRDLCFLAEGLRTNREGADQVERTLLEIGVKEVIRVGLPWGTMHLDGMLNFLDRDLAAIWPRRTPFKIVDSLRHRGFRFIEIENEEEAQNQLSLNFVALQPGEILMPAGGNCARSLFEEAGVTCHTVEIGELIKAGGGIHCMTGLLKRDDR